MNGKILGSIFKKGIGHLKRLSLNQSVNKTSYLKLNEFSLSIIERLFHKRNNHLQLN